MDSREIKQLAEENLGFILKRAVEAEGRLTQDDLASGSLFCRIAEVETCGSPYAGALSVDGAEFRRLVGSSAPAN